MSYLADSCAELGKGRQDRYMVWQSIPVYDSPREKFVLVVVF